MYATFCSSDELLKIIVQLLFQNPHPMLYITVTRTVRKESNHFEYLENRSRGFNVTWQPIRGDLTVHP